MRWRSPELATKVRGPTGRGSRADAGRVFGVGALARGELWRPHWPRTAMRREKESARTPAPAAALYESPRWRPSLPNLSPDEREAVKPCGFVRGAHGCARQRRAVMPMPPANADAGNRDGGPVREGRPQIVAPNPRRDVGKSRGVRAPSRRRRASDRDDHCSNERLRLAEGMQLVRRPCHARWFMDR